MAESPTQERRRVAESAIVEVALDDLIPHPRNYRSHPPAQIAHVAASIAANGVYRNVVAARDLTLLAGHGVVEAARSLGLATIPVRILPIDPFSAPALAVLAGDNASARLAEDDEAMLADILRTIADEDAALLLGTGHDELTVDALIARLAADPFDPASEWHGMPEFQQEAQTAAFQCHVNFASMTDLDAFEEAVGQRVPRNIKSIWYPAVERQSARAFGYDSGES